jgi:HK97 family phage portal protein
VATSAPRFFPRFTAPLPSTNGNGKHAAPSASEAKGISLVGPGWARSDFWPVDASGHTTRHHDGGVAGLGWYRAAWLVYACMAHRAEKVSEAPLWIREEKDGEESWVKGDHPLAGLLKRPNPDMRMRAFLEISSLYLDGTGRVCWVKVRSNGGGVAELRPFAAFDVLETRSARGEDGVQRYFGEFRIRTALAPEGKWHPAADVIHLYNPDPDDPRGCVALLDVAAEAAGIGRTLAASIRAGLRNSVVPGFVVTIPPDLSQDQKDELRAGYAAGYESARQQGKTLVLSGGATGARQKLGFAGLEGGTLAMEQEVAVCAVFRVPPVIIGARIGLENSSDRHNLETSRDLFYENAVEPVWTRMEEAFTDDLLAEVDSNELRFVRFDKSRIRAYQDDITAKADAVVNLREELDLDERRAILGYAEATPEQRAEIEAANATPAPMPPAPDAGAKALERKSDALTWAVHDALTSGQEFAWQMASAEQLAADRAAVLGIMADSLKAAAAPTERKDDAPFGPADPAAVRALIKDIAAHLDMQSAEQWRARVTPLTASTARRAVERASAELGISFDLLQPGLLAYVEQHAAELVTQVTDTTKQAIRDALAEGLLEGEGIPELTKRIADIGAFGDSRAELIARTETVAVTNGAQVQSMSRWAAENGGTVTKRWLSAGDGRVRPAHRALNGEVRGIDEAFSNGLQHPAEPNCRCTTVMSLEEAA